MTGCQKAIFALALATTLAAAGCGANSPATATPPAPAVTGAAEPATGQTDDARIDQLIGQLANEKIIRGSARGGTQLFPGEGDLHHVPAVDALVAIGRPAIKPLRKALNDGNPTVRRNAAFALARLGDTSVCENLYTVAESDDLPPVIRAKAVRLLAELARRDGAALDMARLERLFAARMHAGDASRHVRVAVLEAAAADAGPSARELITAHLVDPDPALRAAAIEAASKIAWDKPPVAVVAPSLKNAQGRVVLAAAEALAQWGAPELAGHLDRLLASADPDLRVKAVGLVGRTNPPHAADMLARALADRDLAVQRAAVAALEAVGQTAMLESALEHPRWRIRQAAAEALGRLGKARSVPALVAAAEDKSFNVRAAVAEAMGRVGDAAAAGTLVKLLADPAMTVRVPAARAFARISGDAMEDYNPSLPAAQNAEAIARARKWAADRRGAPAGAAPAAAARPGERAADIETLIGALALPPGETRRLAVDALVREGPAAVPQMERAVDARSEEIARALLDEVLPLVDPMYRDLRDLKVGEPPRRRQAAIALASLSRDRALPERAWSRVRAVLADESDPLVHRMLVELLYARRDPHLPNVLLKSLRSGPPEARETAARYLGKLKVASAVPALVQALQDERHEVQYAAAWALGELGDEAAVGPLRARMVTGRTGGRLAFGAALARLGDASGRDELVRLMAEGPESVQVAAANAMAAAPSREYVPTLVAHLDPDRLHLADAATRALRAATGEDFDYRPELPPAARKEAIRRWRSWYEETQLVRPLGE